MIHILSALKELQICKKIQVDHWSFRLHYRVTVLILLLFCVLVSTKQYAGDPIRCSRDSRDHSALIDNYCYISSTYTIKTAFNLTPLDGVPHPGITHRQDPSQTRYHSYYQWIGLILFVQAVLFYFPHLMWKFLEGGSLSALLERNAIFPTEEHAKVRDALVSHLRSRWQDDRLFIAKYVLCEVACLTNLIGQMSFLDCIFENEYFCFGIEALRYMKGSLADNPFTRMFPRVTSCTYYYIGEGGRGQKMSVLCVLAVNVVNEKIFLFLWFWFVFLGTVTICTMTFKLSIFALKSVRMSLLCIRFPSVPVDDFKVIVKTGNLGNYLFIHLLGQNMDEIHFGEIISEFVTLIKGGKD